MFFENKVIPNRKKHNIQQRISPAASCIPEGLQGKPFFKKGIKKIYQPQDAPSYAFVNFIHWPFSNVVFRGEGKIKSVFYQYNYLVQYILR